MSEELYEGIFNALTYDEVAASLTYDPETGIVRWKVNHGWNKAGDAGVGNRNSEIYLLGNALKLRRVAWLLHYGEWPLGNVKTLDGNEFNLRIDNLEDTGVIHGSTISSKFRGRRGVSKGEGRYYARCFGGGSFDTQEEAARAVDHVMKAKWGYRVNYKSEEEAAEAVAKAREKLAAKVQQRALEVANVAVVARARKMSALGSHQRELERRRERIEQRSQRAALLNTLPPGEPKQPAPNNDLPMKELK